MNSFDSSFDVARDNLAIYSGALSNVIILLEDKPTAKADELDAYRQELARVRHELNHMLPEDAALVNKANYIYARLSRDLMDEYLAGTPEKEIAIEEEHE